MAMKRHERTTARRVALQVLYTAEIKGITTAEVVAEGTFPSEEGTLTDYALDLVRGVENNRIAIDGNLKAAAENWSLGRMPIVDRSILRIATYEILFVEDVPTSVAINEAVELAKDFGGEDESPRFVNGVLGRIAKDVDAEASAPRGDDPAQPLVL
ncbi:transcription antitermination factor NusB [Senegalimassilia faecalis]|uniref:transcription antitermination factor NusB n=1 Tax=Senegalimassilia faecalis TaxID=2509433 RepID=UPI003076B0D4